MTVGKGRYLCSSTKRVVNHESANQKLRFDISGSAELSELTGNDFFHNFSLKSNDNECMFTLINTFGYILPCPTCKKHYNYLINDIYVLNKDEMNKKKMIKYLYEIHNIIDYYNIIEL